MSIHCEWNISRHAFPFRQNRSRKYSRFQWNIPRHLLKSGPSEIATTTLAILNGCLLSLARAMLKLCLTCHVDLHSWAGLVTSRHIYKPPVSIHSKLYLIKIVLVMERSSKKTDWHLSPDDLPFLSAFFLGFYLFWHWVFFHAVFYLYIIFILPILPCQCREKDKNYFINISLTLFPEESILSWSPMIFAGRRSLFLYNRTTCILFYFISSLCCCTDEVSVTLSFVIRKVMILATGIPSHLL